MIHVEMQQAQAELPLYLEKVEHGETVVVCKDRHPIAEIRPIVESEPPAQRRLGTAKGTFEVTESFFDPLPDDLLAAFNCEEE